MSQGNLNNPNRAVRGKEFALSEAVLIAQEVAEEKKNEG
jgi:hypothetical protein